MRRGFRITCWWERSSNAKAIQVPQLQFSAVILSVRASADVTEAANLESVRLLNSRFPRDRLAGMSDVTRILSQIESGDSSAAEKLLPLVYDELRKLAAVRLAQEKPGQTLQATALVHEAYLRLVGSGDREPSWNNRAHFFGAAAEAMRRILINRARDKGRQKRGGQGQRIDLEQVELAVDATHEDLLALDESIERLAVENSECAKVVKLRFFAGLSIDDTAAAMGVSPSTAKRHWAYARAWLFDSLRSEDGASSS
jgi:RNA polymerase sigma factor (TIGR02999 family)